MMKKARKFYFESNFDTSVILPFYKKSEVFERTIVRNHGYFQRNGIEVIIVMDEPTEQTALIRTIKTFPLINWKVIVNETPHPWRNPSKAINVGIKASSKKYILVMGPDSEMVTDVIFEARKMAEYYQNSFFVGTVAFVDYDYKYVQSEGGVLDRVYYGSIFLEKKILSAINGYDERYERWGGDDDNIRSRLERYGIKKMKLPSCVLLHRETAPELKLQRQKSKTAFRGREMNELRNSFLPQNHLANNDADWGLDFSKTIYDWSNNPFAEELCLEYLAENGFRQFQIKPGGFHSNYQVIALISTYNEKKQFPGLSIHLEAVCDGFILLDDASSDNTFDAVHSDKLLLKVKKESRVGFNDLQNRNALLDLASFFKTSYIFFIDADERLDARYSDLRAIAISNRDDTYKFHLVHLWDDENLYRIDVPEVSQIKQRGVLQRWRMFRNIGRMQITGDRLHFEATPYKTATGTIAPILIKHYGLIDQSTRHMKYDRYMVEDDNLALKPDKYEYFLQNKVSTGQVSDILLPT